MFAIVGIVLLLLQTQLHPGEWTVAGQPLPLAGLAVALGLFGLAVDLRLRRSQLVAAPRLGWALALAGWMLATAPAAAPLAFATYFLIAHGVQSFRALTTVATALVLLAVWLGVRAVRRGADDAGEATMALAVAWPLAVASFERNQSAARTFLLLLTMVVTGLCVIVTQSRGGQMVLATVLVVHFGTRHGARGYLLAALAVAALFTCGGVGAGWRSSGGAGAVPAPMAPPDAGTLVLAGALGLVSFHLLAFLWRHYAEDDDAAVARTWARALAASLAGASVGVWLLPSAQQRLLWIYAGLVAALVQATRAHDPTLDVRKGRRELWRVFALAVGILGLRCL